MFFRLSSLELGLLVFAIVLGTTLAGVVLGRHLRAHAEVLREPVGVLQAALLGLVALILAFGLTLAVGRYDARRAAVVATANAIGTTYLRAQTLREPMRTRSLDELEAAQPEEHRCLLRRTTKSMLRPSDGLSRGHSGDLGVGPASSRSSSPASGTGRRLFTAPATIAMMPPCTPRVLGIRPRPRLEARWQLCFLPI